MRKLLGTLYVTTPDAYLSLDGENIVISVKQEEIRRIPLHNLENIVSFGYQAQVRLSCVTCANAELEWRFLSQAVSSCVELRGSGTEMSC